MITDLKAFCELFYASTSIPIGYYHASPDDDCSFPSILEDPSVFKGILSGFRHFTKNPDYFIAQSFSYYGYIKPEHADCVIIIGPVFSTPISDLTLRTFMQEWAISQEHKPDILQFLVNIPQISFNQFLQTLAWLHLCFNDEYISVGQHFNLENTSIISEFSNVHSNQVMNAKEEQHFHNTYHFEQKLLQYIQNGDVEKMKTLLNTPSKLSGGLMADNSLRQEKNVFITTVAIVTRSAIAGGMDMEQAYQLADVYIRECEKLQNISHIETLSYSMLIDFTERVSQNKIPQGMSLEIFECIQFITHHINESIRVGDVAEHIGRSRSYLTNKFKKELGFDVCSFIIRCKLEEAKSLLTYSDKTLSEISNYLCFSSQAYFQTVFKKKYGLTPTQYRNQTHKIY